MVVDTLNETKRLVWPEIKKYLKDAPYPSQFSLPERYKKDINLYWKINREYPERKGKYLRPTLVRLVAEALGLRNNKLTRVAAAMQLSEDWILIHDDIIDKSETRRDKPSLHKLYGQDLAINAGDALHTIMWKVVLDTKLPKITDEFYKIVLRTTLGQGVEQIWTNKGKKPSKEEYFFIADSKSGYYSIAGPMRLGAIAAGATPKQIKKITDFGLHLGRCFQLVDDILDIKQDKIEGKITLANLKGATYVKNLALKEKNKAKEIFDRDLEFMSKEPARTELKELIDFILDRKY